MNRRAQRALVIVAVLALPALASADNTEMVAKRARFWSVVSAAERFRSMGTVYPYHVIKRGGPVSELPRAIRKLDVTYSFAGERHSLNDLLARSRTQGFLVIKDRKIVDERYFNGADEQSKFTSWSGTHPFPLRFVLCKEDSPRCIHHSDTDSRSRSHRRFSDKRRDRRAEWWSEVNSNCRYRFLNFQTTPSCYNLRR
jgi:hypothetical protein